MDRLSCKQIDVVGVGSVVLDFLVVLPEYPAPNSKNEMQDFSQQAGGNIATALVTLTRLGASAAYLGKMGDNDFTRCTLEALREQGVHVEHVVLSRIPSDVNWLSWSLTGRPGKERSSGRSKMPPF